MKSVLVTGTAGFIGYHLTALLKETNFIVYGIDNINDYYSIRLKYDRLRELGFYKENLIKNKFSKSILYENLFFMQADLENQEILFTIFHVHKFDYVIHLAAQAGVRHSIENPQTYINSNIIGFFNILEACRKHIPEHFIFASSSSVYGLNNKIPFSIHDNTDHPVSLYAATKKSNELFAHSYSSLFNIPVSGLRFFTVYGPWGRPDMAYFLFTKKILNDETIHVFNEGNLLRDFTYIDDITKGITNLMKMERKPDPKWDRVETDPATSSAPYNIYNLGNNNPVTLKTFISILENVLGKKAKIEYFPMQPGDVEKTFADISDSISDFNFKPEIELEYGLKSFAQWYVTYHNEYLSNE